MEPRSEVQDDDSDDEGETVYDEARNINVVVRKDAREDGFHFDEKARSSHN